MSESNELLERVLQRCQSNLTADCEAMAYLRGNGVVRVETARAIRAGVADEALQESLSDTADNGLEAELLHAVTKSSAVLIPTFDPREPLRPLGLIRQNFAQNRHGFATPARGVACMQDIATHARVVLCDAPLLAMRLIEAGVSGVALVESPEVLPPLRDWLSSRGILLASYKLRGVQLLAAGLGELADRAERVQVACELNKMSGASWRLLGVDIEKPVEQVPSPSPELLGELVAFGRARIAQGEGLELLREYGADDAAFLEAYGIGFLPVGFQAVLSADARKSISNRIEGNTLLVPAFDEGGRVVDVMALRPKSQRRSIRSLHAEPLGLIAPKIAKSCSEVAVTDSLRIAARMFKHGKTGTILLRGVQDARANSQRLALSGVQAATVHARRDAPEIARALESAGITAACEVVSMPRRSSEAEAGHAESITSAQSAPVCGSLKRVAIDRETEQAQFRAGDAAYTVDAPLQARTKLLVRLESCGIVALDKFDVAVEAQRRRFASSAALKLKLRAESIDAHLVAILDELQRWRESLHAASNAGTQSEGSSSEESAHALAMLKRADLLDVLAQDLESLGWVGEDQTKRLLYLVSISRKLDAPLSAALLASSGAGKSKSVETVAELTPPEDLLHVSRVTDSALYYQDKDALRHKLLVVDEADALTPEVLVSLRILQSRGVLSQTHVLRDSLTGNASTQFVETRGPVAVLTSTAGTLEEQMLSRCFQIGIDESPEQTARILEAQRKLRADRGYQGRNGRHATIVARHHALQRQLEALPVVVPFADRIQFPSTSIKHRREQERFLNLIEASALLHQHQRVKESSASGDVLLVADIRDYEIALTLAAAFVGRAADELSHNARAVLALIQSARMDAFDINDLHALQPQWTRHRFRSGLDELLQLDVIATGKRSRPRRYELCASAAALMSAPAVRLLPVCDLAGLGETAFANSKPVRAIG